MYFRVTSPWTYGEKLLLTTTKVVSPVLFYIDLFQQCFKKCYNTKIKSHLGTYYNLLLLCIFNPVCRGTMRHYVEQAQQVLRLCTVLVFPPPLEFSCAHIYSEVLPTHISYTILLYTVKNLRLLKLWLKVIYMIKIV